MTHINYHNIALTICLINFPILAWLCLRPGKMSTARQLVVLALLGISTIAATTTPPGWWS